MIILKINRFIEKHGKLAMLIIAAAVVIPFVFMWGPHSVFEDAPGRRRVRNLGTMYGKPIRAEELIRQLRFAVLEKMEREGEIITLTRGEEGQRLLEQALQRMRFLREAEERGLHMVTESQIDEWITMLFKGEDGRFDRQYYQFFSRLILPNAGLTEMDYREFIEQRIIINRLWQEIINSVFASPLEINNQIRRNHEEFRAAYRIFNQTEFYDQAETALVSDAEIRRYFDANRGAELPDGEVITELDEETKAVIRQHLMREVSQQFYRENITFLKPYVEETETLQEALALYEQRYEFASPQPPAEQFPFTPQEARDKSNRYIRPIYEPVRKKFKLAVFNQNDYWQQVEVSTQQLRQAYERQSEKYERQVRARHILIRPEGETEEELEAARTESRKQLIELREKIVDDADFSELARQYSEDPGSAPAGGELGAFRRNQMVEPFARAAFALEEGEVSEIVETDFGYHLIKVDEIIPAKEFNEVKDELEEEIRKEQAREAAWAAADDFSYQLYEKAAGTGLTEHRQIMEQMAKEKNIRIIKTDFFNSRNWPEVFKNDIQAAGEVYDMTSELPISEAVEANGQFLVALFIDSRPPMIPSFDREDRIQRLMIEWARQEKSLTLARQAAGRAHEEITAEYGLKPDSNILIEQFEFTQTDHFSRTSPPRIRQHEYSWLMLEKLDHQPIGALGEPIESRRGSILMMLSERIPPDQETIAEKQESARRQVLNRKAEWQMNAFIEQVEARSQTELIDNPLSYILR